MYFARGSMIRQVVDVWHNSLEYQEPSRGSNPMLLSDPPMRSRGRNQNTSESSLAQVCFWSIIHPRIFSWVVLPLVGSSMPLDNAPIRGNQDSWHV